jgi:hypothetical protein
MPIQSSLSQEETSISINLVIRLNVLFWKWLSEWDTIIKELGTETIFRRFSPSALPKRKCVLSIRKKKAQSIVSSRVVQISYSHTAPSSSTRLVM